MAAPPFNSTRAAGTIPTPYVLGNLPARDDGWPLWTRQELGKVKETLDTLIILTPQAADRAPARLIEGMIRLAKAPWRPVAGQTTDQWVTYVGGAWRYV